MPFCLKEVTVRKIPGTLSIGTAEGQVDVYIIQLTYSLSIVMALGFVHLSHRKTTVSVRGNESLHMQGEFISPPSAPPTTTLQGGSVEVTVLWGNRACRLEPPRAEQGNEPRFLISQSSQSSARNSLFLI